MTRKASIYARDKTPCLSPPQGPSSDTQSIASSSGEAHQEQNGSSQHLDDDAASTKSSTSSSGGGSKERAQQPGPASNGGTLNLTMSAKELRAKLAQRKKYDPKKESLGFKDKFDIIQKL